MYKRKKTDRQIDSLGDGPTATVRTAAADIPSQLLLIDTGGRLSFELITPKPRKPELHLNGGVFWCLYSTEPLCFKASSQKFVASALM